MSKSFNWSLIDTHTHFDMQIFKTDRQQLARIAYQKGIRHLVLVGIATRYFEQMWQCQQMLNSQYDTPSPTAHLAFGIHPLYVGEHSMHDLHTLDEYLGRHQALALGEIGLDSQIKDPHTQGSYEQQRQFFVGQLDIAKRYKLPVLLHIRKAHADTLQLLKAHRFDGGGIAHSFSGGIQEAYAFIDLGFKIGITGQITNPNAKKLRSTIQQLATSVGIEHLVIESDCPNFTPIPCHTTHQRRNSPETLVYVLAELSKLLNINPDTLAQSLWTNSLTALQLNNTNALD